MRAEKSPERTLGDVLSTFGSNPYMLALHGFTPKKLRKAYNFTNATLLNVGYTPTAINEIRHMTEEELLEKASQHDNAKIAEYKKDQSHFL